MIVRVEACRGGHDNHYFRLIIPPDGDRESIIGHEWNRATAKAALDLLEALYPGVYRRNVRFKVK